MLKYFREYPWWLQLVLFVLMVFTMLSFSSFLLIYLSPKITGVDVTQLAKIDEHSPRQMINAAIFFQFISSIGIFLVPALLFAYLTHPRPALYLGMRLPGRPAHWLLVILLMLGAMPVFLGIEGLLKHVDFGAGAKAMQEQNDRTMGAFLQMSSFADFIKVFVVLAIVPAVGEELFFRGILLRFAKKRSRSMVFPVIFTSLVFALSHTNIYGLLPIFLAGALLAVIFYLTGSIWCSMLGHLINNGLQVVLVYLASTNSALKAAMDADTLPVYLPIAGLVVFCLSFYWLLKVKTPLPPGWANDFEAKEFVMNE